jgi:hypothetical protein
MQQSDIYLVSFYQNQISKHMDIWFGFLLCIIIFAMTRYILILVLSEVERVLQEYNVIKLKMQKKENRKKWKQELNDRLTEMNRRIQFIIDTHNKYPKKTNHKFSTEDIFC